MKLRTSIRKHYYKYSAALAETWPMNRRVNAFWWRDRANIGDALNADLIAGLADQRPLHWVPPGFAATHYLAIGSILHFATSRSIVWGSGFIEQDSVPINKPQEILAVRGPKTRQRLLELGIPAPAIYGDPALLMPSLVNPEVEKRYRLGLVPHFVDKTKPFMQQSFGDNVLVIDVETGDTESFIAALKSCEAIVSSSLHGIILADAYGIPAHRISFGDDIIGGDFKFHDYFLSVGREPTASYQLSESTTAEELMNLEFDTGVTVSTDELLACCPFTT